MKLPYHLNLIVLIACCSQVSFAQSKSSGSEEANRLFTLKVLPTLKEKCFGCHGDNKQDIKGEYDVTNLEALIAGGESGETAVVVASPDESPLYWAVCWENGLEMPPKENDRLNADQIKALRRWIELGAPWPTEEQQKAIQQEAWAVEETEAGRIVKTSGGLSDQWTYRRYAAEDLWSWQPLQEVAVDEQYAIDSLIEQKLSEAGFKPAEEADPRTLIRRATYDLHGLPPTPKQVREFVASWEKDSEQAWAILIDELLESPRYGERWGQHWLDIARYADTGGYSNDYERSNAWRYRDYVIRSLNNDKSYRQFVIEQLAGDELADASVRARTDGEDSEQTVREARLTGEYTQQESEWLIATGFLRMGPWDNAMVKSEEARHIYLDDVVNSVGQTFLSTTMRCVKCHDHKFDPIPTRDYYRLYAAFEGTQMAERKAPFLDSENLEGHAEGQEFVKRMLDFAVAEKNKIKQKQEDAAREWYKEHGTDYVPENDRKNLPDEEKPPRHVGLDHVEQGQLKVREQDEWIWKRRLERYQPMIQSVYNGTTKGLTWNGARKLRINPKSDPKWVPESRILIGGAIEAPGDKVVPGVLSAVGLAVPEIEAEEFGGTPLKFQSNPSEQAADAFVLPPGIEGRRYALAKWIVHPENSLAIRSIVNRIWQYHFGRGLAANANNFGAKGAKPTHPELLEYLAQDFVDGGWTLKRMHRQIMRSKAYRMSSTHSQLKQLREVDPDNKLLAFFPVRRLSAEEIRDSMLAITGELVRKVGGLPAMPEINMEVALAPRMIQFSLAPAYQPDDQPELRNRRTIYAYRVRGLADPFLELFNRPNPNDSCEYRDQASVTPQAFTLLNSDVVTDRSLAMASRLRAESDDIDEQLGSAFRLVFGREPSEKEVGSLGKYYSEMIGYHQSVEPEARKYPTRITRSLVEEFSGRPFEYEEILPAFETYKSDLQACEADVETRALADCCILLFNSNEFAFIY